MNPAVIVLVLRIGLAVALYTFLGLIIVGLWREVQVRGRLTQDLPAARLVTTSLEADQSVFSLDTLNLLGRAADNTICLQDSTVSSYHARLSFQGGQWWLEDLGSRNGTFLNGIQVEEPLVITYGDEIRFGAIRMLLDLGLPVEAELNSSQE